MSKEIIDNSRLDCLFAKLKEHYGTHRRVARELGITEEWYFQVRTSRGLPSNTLIRLMRKIVR